jgi:CelD/BcsL family acetyltransferase involved in cellulose biosynthesis
MSRAGIRAVKARFTTGETENQTIITLETSPAAMAAAWVSFMRQRLHVLHLDCTHIEPGRVVVLSTPHAAESVVRLVLSAMECADRYCRTALRNMRAQQVQDRVAATAAQRGAALDERATTLGEP